MQERTEKDTKNEMDVWWNMHEFEPKKTVYTIEHRERDKGDSAKGSNANNFHCVRTRRFHHHIA